MTRAQRIEEALKVLAERAGWCVTFIQTKERMHSAGQALFLSSLEAARTALALPPEPRSHRCIDDGGDGYECPGCHSRYEKRVPPEPGERDAALEEAARDVERYIGAQYPRDAALRLAAAAIRSLKRPPPAEVRSCLWHADCDAADRALRQGVEPSHPPMWTPPPPAEGEACPECIRQGRPPHSKSECPHHGTGRAPGRTE